jgi:hypothetical protein
MATSGPKQVWTGGRARGPDAGAPGSGTPEPGPVQGGGPAEPAGGAVATSWTQPGAVPPTPTPSRAGAPGGATPEVGPPHGGAAAEAGAGPLAASWTTSGPLPPAPSLPQVSRPVHEVGEVEETTPVPEAVVPPYAHLSPEDVLDEQIRDLEGWARVILKRTRREAARYWTLRGVAFCSAAAAAALALKGYELAPVLLLALSGLTLAIEMGWPGGSQSAVYRRAVSELRELESVVKLRWQKVRLSHPEPSSRKRVAYAVELLELIHSRREEVGRYLGTSPPNEGINRPS